MVGLNGASRCSCVGDESRKLTEGERVRSKSNRNLGGPGGGGPTHLGLPANGVAALGRALADVRDIK
ncbi:MAG: hypothetical protein CM15mP46_5660 [Alphaproteobacteria bacterium]|nr:MAG: hypothetical protein CM15mP46_5660 [Alphaproteobacteria bacterium]